MTEQMFARFTAKCKNATTAMAFEAEAERTCGALNIHRVGRFVQFDAVAVDSDDTHRLHDHRMSARFYGGERTSLTHTHLKTRAQMYADLIMIMIRLDREDHPELAGAQTFADLHDHEYMIDADVPFEFYAKVQDEVTARLPLN